MGQLGLYPGTSDKAATLTVKTITLHDLENTLASMTALIYWAGMHIYPQVSSHLDVESTVANPPDPWLKNISDGVGASASIYDRTVLQGWALVSRTATQLNVRNAFQSTEKNYGIQIFCR
jgi:hypothetical protein